MLEKVNRSIKKGIDQLRKRFGKDAKAHFFSTIAGTSSGPVVLEVFRLFKALKTVKSHLESKKCLSTCGKSGENFVPPPYIYYLNFSTKLLCY